MKTRHGFVSNSSSSSFTCDICGNDYSGWDVNLDDGEMAQCDAGHTFCTDDDCAPGFKAPSEDDFKTPGRCDKCDEDNGYDAKFCKICGDDVYVDEDDCYDEDWRWSVKAKDCPICNLSKINNSTRVDYLLGKVAQTREQIDGEIRGRFKSAGEVTAWRDKELGSQ